MKLPKKTRIIILTLEQHESIGVLVDEVKEVVTLDEDHIERMGYEKDDKERFLSGVGKADGKLISAAGVSHQCWQKWLMCEKAWI